jgi:endonuclease-3 related protein
MLDLYHLLLAEFGPQHWWPAETEFEVIVGALLTQQTRWESVEQAIENLKARSLLTPAALTDTDPGVPDFTGRRQSGCSCYRSISIITG